MLACNFLLPRTAITFGNGPKMALKKTLWKLKFFCQYLSKNQYLFIPKKDDFWDRIFSWYIHKNTNWQIFLYKINNLSNLW